MDGGMSVLELFRKGYAIGQSDILGDCWHFRFENEFFLVRGNIRPRRLGGFWVMKARKLRQLDG